MKISEIFELHQAKPGHKTIRQLCDWLAKRSIPMDWSITKNGQLRNEEDQPMWKMESWPGKVSCNWNEYLKASRGGRHEA